MTANKPQITAERVRELITLNIDARQYFYSQADHRWVNWLWKNEFFDCIKQKSENPSRFGYATPELNYLLRASESEPQLVLEIIHNVPITVETFNPEVISQFLRIGATLPADSLARLVPKIKDEEWVKLMEAFNDGGFSYKDMLKTLSDEKDYASMLLLIDALLSVRNNEIPESEELVFSDDRIFYLRDLSYIQVFDRLNNLDSSYVEQALRLTGETMTKIVSQQRDRCPTKGFLIGDTYALLDVDFFTLEPGQKEGLSSSEEIRELAATMKVLVNKLISNNRVNYDQILSIYTNYIEQLPDSPAMWRFKLYVLSLCPTAFREQLAEALERIFDTQHFHGLMMGTEYLNTLKQVFPSFSKSRKRHFVKQVISRFTQSSEKKDEYQWQLEAASSILSVIAENLTETERTDAAEAKILINPAYTPEPAVGKVTGGTVVSRGPVSPEVFGKYSIQCIAAKLRDDWTPEELVKNNSSGDFLNPLNADGITNLLKLDLPKRLSLYSSQANLFFERGVLDSHYTNSFLTAFQETLSKAPELLENVDLSTLLEMMSSIKKSGITHPFDNENRKEQRRYDTWLYDWRSVHRAIVDVLQVLLKSGQSHLRKDLQNQRVQIFDLIKYLLSYPDPVPEDENPNTASMKTTSPGSSKSIVMDAYSLAINSVRGRAFEVLVLFLALEDDYNTNGRRGQISDEIREVFEGTLSAETTRALMFMFGRYLYVFYHRDIPWIQKLLPTLFPQETGKNHLCLATWEGYLSADLYQTMFNDSAFQKLYERALSHPPQMDPERKHFTNPNKGLAVHFALAFVHYDHFGFDHSLFKLFWNQGNIEHHTKFIQFIGRSIIPKKGKRSNQAQIEKPNRKERLISCWEWLLENYPNNEIFEAFGHWIGSKDVFDSTWLALQTRRTLEKSGGKLESDHGLTSNIVALAKANPKESLEISKLHLLEGSVRGNNPHYSLYFTDEWQEALTELYNNPETKTGTENLIDALVREGGQMFWKLKLILK